MKVGFVGLGLMGVPMARNLLLGGHELFIQSTNAGSRALLQRDGAKIGHTVRDIAATVDVFCSCRVSPEQSKQTFLGADGVMAASRPGLLAIDFATIDPATARAIGAALAARGIGFLDAPISGGPNGAVAATLSIIVGGRTEDVARARPLFDLLGKQVFHMGAVGAGVAAKLCNNMITITTHALIAEAMVLGVKSGIDPRQLYEMLRGSTARSTTLERVVPNHFLPRNFTAAASMVTIMKDLGCAIDAARALGVRTRLPDAAMQCYVEAAERGYGDKDIAAVILPMEKNAGTQVGPA